MKIIAILLIIAICVLLLVFTSSAEGSALTCPTLNNVYIAQLDIVDGSGRHYLIDPIAQGLASHPQGMNIADLQYAANPPRWLVGGVKIVPAFVYRYHVTYWNSSYQSAGEAWFATLKGYPNTYFFFVMPAESADHPNCGFGSTRADAIVQLFKPRA